MYICHALMDGESIIHITIHYPSKLLCECWRPGTLCIRLPRATYIQCDEDQH